MLLSHIFDFSIQPSTFSVAFAGDPEGVSLPGDQRVLAVDRAGRLAVGADGSRAALWDLGREAILGVVDLAPDGPSAAQLTDTPGLSFLVGTRFGGLFAFAR